MHDLNHPAAHGGESPVLIPVEAYCSEDYARAEGEKLWPKVWQAACRIEEIPKVGDYVTYDILDESIVVVRTAADRVQAYFNVCLHRGRRLTTGCGHTAQFYCRFHGWRWSLDGENAFVLDPEDWGEALTPENLRMKQVKVDCWGGWVWINMDPDCEPLLDYLDDVAVRLGPYELEKMRYRWRQWLYFPCNWKTAMGAFIEGYHAFASHPHLVRGPQGMRGWTRLHGRHAAQGDAGLRGVKDSKGGGVTQALVQPGADPRLAAAQNLEVVWETLNAVTTETFVKAARRLVDELPEGVSLAEVGAHLMASAKRDDAARGVVWPELDPAFVAVNSVIWHLFPNTVIINNITAALCYRARPNGFDPDSCIFEVYVIERFPEGQAPATEWVFEPEPLAEKWRLVLAQDFLNMPLVQKGMKSRGFPGARPNPVQELPVIHFNRNLAAYMGTGAPEPIRSA